MVLRGFHPLNNPLQGTSSLWSLQGTSSLWSLQGTSSLWSLRGTSSPRPLRRCSYCRWLGLCYFGRDTSATYPLRKLVTTTLVNCTVLPTIIVHHIIHWTSFLGLDNSTLHFAWYSLVVLLYILLGTLVVQPHHRTTILIITVLLTTKHEFDTLNTTFIWKYSIP
jgi:hypothetical protein